MDTWDQDEKLKTKYILDLARTVRVNSQRRIDDLNLRVIMLKSVNELWKGTRGMIPADIELIDSRISTNQKEISQAEDLIKEGQEIIDRCSVLLKEFGDEK